MWYLSSSLPGRARALTTTITDCKVLINNDLSIFSFATIRRAYSRAMLALLAVTMVASSAFAARGPKKYAKLDDELNDRAGHAPSAETTSVIVRVKGSQLPAEFKKYARPGSLPLINAYVLDVPNSELNAIGVEREHAVRQPQRDRPRVQFQDRRPERCVLRAADDGHQRRRRRRRGARLGRCPEQRDPGHLFQGLPDARSRARGDRSHCDDALRSERPRHARRRDDRR